MALLHHLPQTGSGGRLLTEHPGPYQEGDYVTLECDFGYKLPATPHIVSKVIVAAAGGGLVWEPDPLPSCIPVHCGPPPILPDHASLTNTTLFTFPASTTYVCEAGYVLNHPLATFYCSASGQWTPSIPRTLQCNPVRCPALVAPSNGSLAMIGDGSYGSEATFACDRLYELHGPTQRVCEADGQWSGEEVECRALACPPLDPKTFRLLIPENGPLQMIDCGNGKVVTLKCLGQGRWSKPWPYCDVLPPPPPPPVSPPGSPVLPSPPVSPPGSPVQPETPPVEQSPPPSPAVVVVAPKQVLPNQPRTPTLGQNVPAPSQNVPAPSQNVPAPSQNVPSQTTLGLPVFNLGMILCMWVAVAMVGFFCVFGWWIT